MTQAICFDEARRPSAKRMLSIPRGRWLDEDLAYATLTGLGARFDGVLSARVASTWD